MYKLKIKEFRKQKKLTQKDVSKLTGISRNYISELENAKHSATIEILMMISRGLNIRPDRLIEYEDKNDNLDLLTDRQKLKKRIIDLIIEDNHEATNEFIKNLFDEIIKELERKS